MNWKYKLQTSSLVLLSILSIPHILIPNSSSICRANDSPVIFKKNLIETEFFFQGATYIKASDIDIDGDIDLVAVADSSDVLAWFENDGEYQFTMHNIQLYFDGANSVDVADIDGDNDLDIVATAFGSYHLYHGEVSWFENDGQQNFTKQDIDMDIRGANSGIAIDIDNDGDCDVVAGAWDSHQVILYENDGQGNFEKHIFNGELENVYALDVVDFDSDGDLDVLGSGTSFMSVGLSDELTWFENTGSPLFLKHEIEINYDGVRSIKGIDIDNDEDVDFVGACFDSNKVKWWENDGTQTFSNHTLEYGFSSANSICIAELDNGLNVDIIAAHSAIDEEEDGIIWFKNLNGTTFNKFIVDREFTHTRFLLTYDLDQDGDQDIIACEWYGDIAWWENQPNVIVELNMPSDYFREGDPCRLTAEITNHSNYDLEQIPLFVILDVYGEYWFWPTWTQTGEYQLMDIPMGLQEQIIIEPFTWPSNTGSATGIFFWGALTKTDFSNVLGTFGFWEFGWGM